MFNDDVRDLMRTYDQQDMLASALKTALIVAVPFGGVIGEFVTHFVPRQRVSRLMEFIEEMNNRLAGLEKQVNERLSSSPAYSALAEEATVMAVRSSSTRRRRDLVELLKTGLARPDAELLEHEALLRTLERLNDAQILILMKYGNFKGNYGDKELLAFQEAHPGVFDTRPPDSGTTEEEVRRWTVYRMFEDGLVSLGLLRDTEGTIRSGHRRRVAITDLGRILLEAIGRSAV